MPANVKVDSFYAGGFAWAVVVKGIEWQAASPVTSEGAAVVNK